jgi:hypothetical protein
MSTCVWKRYDSQYCFQTKQELNTKSKTGHYQYVQSKIKQVLNY